MIPEFEELYDMMDFLEDRNLIEENKKFTKLLLKKGIKIREHQWTELEAS